MQPSISCAAFCKARALKSFTWGITAVWPKLWNVPLKKMSRASPSPAYQGGHVEFFKYMKDLLSRKWLRAYKNIWRRRRNNPAAEIEELHQYGITRIYIPDDGRQMGLEGMIEDVLHQCDYLLMDLSSNRQLSTVNCQPPTVNQI